MNEAGTNIVLEPKRNTLSEIYSYIIDDLKYAADNLNTTPYGNNRARVSRKAAMGLLARAYIQGAGQGLSEDTGKELQMLQEVLFRYGSWWRYLRRLSL